jgi:hypothetical protein
MHKSVTMVGLMASVLAATSALATPASAAVVRAPEGASVSVVTVNGSGCPDGEGSAKLSATGASFSITTPAYIAAAGGPAGPTDFRENCQVGVRFSGIEGWTYAVTRVTATGFAYLAPAASGLTRTSLYFQGTSQTTAANLLISGPVAEPWTATETVDAADLNWAPCDSQRDLNVNTELRVIGGAGLTASVMVRDAVTAGRLVWQRCPAA